MKWTQAERDRLTEMWGDGYSFTSKQIAQELGRPRNSIVGAISRLGLPKRGCVRETTNYPDKRKPAVRVPKPFDYEKPKPHERTKSELYAMLREAAANTAKM